MKKSLLPVGALVALAVLFTLIISGSGLGGYYWWTMHRALQASQTVINVTKVLPPNECPVDSKQCPDPAECPVDSKVCPVDSKQCPEPTECPVDSKVCPVDSKQCPNPSECPVDSRVCPVCPVDSKQCPEPTECPVDSKVCPVDSKQCPNPSECPVDSKVCPPTDSKQCPVIDVVECDPQNCVHVETDSEGNKTCMRSEPTDCVTECPVGFQLGDRVVHEDMCIGDSYLSSDRLKCTFLSTAGRCGGDVFCTVGMQAQDYRHPVNFPPTGWELSFSLDTGGYVYYNSTTGVTLQNLGTEDAPEYIFPPEIYCEPACVDACFAPMFSDGDSGNDPYSCVSLAVDCNYECPIGLYDSGTDELPGLVVAQENCYRREPDTTAKFYRASNGIEYTRVTAVGFCGGSTACPGFDSDTQIGDIIAFDYCTAECGAVYFDSSQSQHFCNTQADDVDCSQVCPTFERLGNWVGDSRMNIQESNCRNYSFYSDNTPYRDDVYGKPYYKASNGKMYSYMETLPVCGGKTDCHADSIGFIEREYCSVESYPDRCNAPVLTYEPIYSGGNIIGWNHEYECRSLQQDCKNKCPVGSTIEGITVTQQQCQDINGNLDVTGTNPEAIWYLASTGLLYTDLERPGFCGGDTSCFGHPENPSCNDNTNFIEVPILEYSLDSDSQLFLIETGYRNDSFEAPCSCPCPNKPNCVCDPTCGCDICHNDECPGNCEDMAGDELLYLCCLDPASCEVPPLRCNPDYWNYEPFCCCDIGNCPWCETEGAVAAQGAVAASLRTPPVSLGTNSYGSLLANLRLYSEPLEPGGLSCPPFCPPEPSAECAAYLYGCYELTQRFLWTKMKWEFYWKCHCECEGCKCGDFDTSQCDDKVPGCNPDEIAYCLFDNSCPPCSDPCSPLFPCDLCNDNLNGCPDPCNDDNICCRLLYDSETTVYVRDDTFNDHDAVCGAITNDDEVLLQCYESDSVNANYCNDGNDGTVSNTYNEFMEYFPHVCAGDSNPNNCLQNWSFLSDSVYTRSVTDTCAAVNPNNPVCNRDQKVCFRTNYTYANGCTQERLYFRTSTNWGLTTFQVHYAAASSSPSSPTPTIISTSPFLATFVRANGGLSAARGYYMLNSLNAARSENGWTHLLTMPSGHGIELITGIVTWEFDNLNNTISSITTNFPDIDQSIGESAALVLQARSAKAVEPLYSTVGGELRYDIHKFYDFSGNYIEGFNVVDVQYMADCAQGPGTSAYTIRQHLCEERIPTFDSSQCPTFDSQCPITEDGVACEDYDGRCYAPVTDEFGTERCVELPSIDCRVDSCSIACDPNRCGSQVGECYANVVPAQCNGDNSCDSLVRLPCATSGPDTVCEEDVCFRLNFLNDCDSPRLEVKTTGEHRLFAFEIQETADLSLRIDLRSSQYTEVVCGLSHLIITNLQTHEAQKFCNDCMNCLDEHAPNEAWSAVAYIEYTGSAGMTAYDLENEFANLQIRYWTSVWYGPHRDALYCDTSQWGEVQIDTAGTLTNLKPSAGSLAGQRYDSSSLATAADEIYARGRRRPPAPTEPSNAVACATSEVMIKQALCNKAHDANDHRWCGYPCLCCEENLIFENDSCPELCDGVSYDSLCFNPRNVVCGDSDSTSLCTTKCDHYDCSSFEAMCHEQGVDHVASGTYGAVQALSCDAYAACEVGRKQCEQLFCCPSFPHSGSCFECDSEDTNKCDCVTKCGIDYNTCLGRGDLVDELASVLSQSILTIFENNSSASLNDAIDILQGDSNLQDSIALIMRKATQTTGHLIDDNLQQVKSSLPAFFAIGKKFRRFGNHIERTINTQVNDSNMQRLQGVKRRLGSHLNVNAATTLSEIVEILGENAFDSVGTMNQIERRCELALDMCAQSCLDSSLEDSANCALTYSCPQHLITTSPDTYTLLVDSIDGYHGTQMPTIQQSTLEIFTYWMQVIQTFKICLANSELLMPAAFPVDYVIKVSATDAKNLKSLRYTGFDRTGSVDQATFELVYLKGDRVTIEVDQETASTSDAYMPGICPTRLSVSIYAHAIVMYQDLQTCDVYCYDEYGSQRSRTMRCHDFDGQLGHYCEDYWQWEFASDNAYVRHPSARRVGCTLNLNGDCATWNYITGKQTDVTCTDS